MGRYERDEVGAGWGVGGRRSFFLGGELGGGGGGNVSGSMCVL